MDLATVVELADNSYQSPCLAHEVFFFFLVLGEGVFSFSFWGEGVWGGKLEVLFDEYDS